MTRPSLVVRAQIGEPSSRATERWFDAMISALGGAVTAGVIGEWTISTPGTGVEPGVLEPYRDRAIAGGGSMVADMTVDDEQLTLVVDRAALLLTTTIVRLVDGLGADGAPVRARQIPLDASDAAESACVLGRGDLTVPDRLAARYCAEAVVHVDGRLSPQSSAAPEAPATGSLLEASIDAERLEPVRAGLERELDGGGEPGLTVIMRSQGARPEALRDALLSLAGQTDERFELLLVVHNGDSGVVSRVLGDQPRELRSRARVIAVEGGTRSRPLNAGIAEARHARIAFLDDDDLVFADWVECFLRAAMSAPRSLLRASVAVQWASAVPWHGGIDGFRNAAELTTPYPKVFDLADHIRVNMTPFMAFAFPTAFFGVFGGADEELDVCEDWDLVLRAASVLGVVDIPAVTAIYRRWDSGRDSYSSHDAAQWARDMRRVRSKLDERVILLPPGSAGELAALSAARETDEELRQVYGSTSWRVTAPLRSLVTALSRRGRAGRMGE